MIEANELRVNNWYLLDGKPFQLTLEAFEQVIVFKTMDRLEPIVLVPEVIARCSSSFAFAEDFRCELGNDHDISKVWIEQYAEGLQPLKHILYLHQLQTLHYALTGEELPFTP